MLISCPECGGSTSSLADTCPTCGFPLFLGSSGEEASGAMPGLGLKRVERVVLGALHSQPIEWVPGRIDCEEGLVLLVSSHVLARRPFSLSGKCSWWEADLMSWSKAFAYDLFTSDERRIVVGDPFVPTARQASELFRGDAVRKAWPLGSPCAGPWDVNRSVPYWLSTSGDEEGKVQYVRPDGRIYTPGADPADELGVRLAVWVEPNSAV